MLIDFSQMLSIDLNRIGWSLGAGEKEKFNESQEMAVQKHIRICKLFWEGAALLLLQILLRKKVWLDGAWSNCSFAEWHRVLGHAVPLLQLRALQERLLALTKCTL